MGDYHICTNAHAEEALQCLTNQRENKWEPAVQIKDGWMWKSTGASFDAYLRHNILYFTEKKMPNPNRAKGIRYELEIRELFESLGWTCTTSRYSSREKDDAKIDLCSTDPFAIQCKFSDKLNNYHTVLSEMNAEPTEIKLMFHKRTRRGTVVAIELEDFKEILQMLISSGSIKPK